MREKLTIEQFLVLKCEILEHLEQLADTTIQTSSLTSRETEKSYYEKLINDFYESFYKHKIRHILSFDLSCIPKENWSEMVLMSMNGDILDFEGTYANIDFKEIDVSMVNDYNFKTCRIFNLVQANLTIDPNRFDSKVISANQNLFLDDTFPQEFKNKFYAKGLTFSDYFALNEYQKKSLDKILFLTRLNNDDLNFILDILNISSSVYSLLPEECSSIYDFAAILGTRFEKARDIYNEILLIIYKLNLDTHLREKLDFTSQDDFFASLYDVYDRMKDVEKSFDETFYKQIKNGKIVDYVSLSDDTFRRTYPYLFLNSDIPELQNKFVSRTLTLEDFKAHPEYLDYFKYTDLFAGLDPIYSLFIGEINMPCTKMQNANKLKIAAFYASITFLDDINKVGFVSYCTRNIDHIDESKLKDVCIVLTRLTYSNSGKLARLKDELCDMLLQSDNPIETLNRIEQIYLTNNLPDAAKIFAVFRVLHSKEDGSLLLNLNDNSSPVLNAHSNKSNEIIIYSDLLKSAIESNNLSLQNYIRTLEEGERLLYDVDDLADYEQIPIEEKQVLTEYTRHLIALYNQTIEGKKSPFISSGNTAKDLFVVKNLFGNVEHLNDHIVRMFMHFIGIDDLATLKGVMECRAKYRDAYSRKIEKEKFDLSHGDLIKGLGADFLNYLFPTMQNGALSTEFLGSEASKDGDNTPLDTDLSIVVNTSVNMSETINQTKSVTYGPTWLVIKNTSPFVYVSRGITEKESGKYLKNKLEAFETLGSGHYGIRTGFGSTNIDFIITEEYSPHMGLAIVMQGFYIPIVDCQGKLLFTSAMFDEYRACMAGLSYYGTTNYTLSNRLVTDEIASIVDSLDESNADVDMKNTIIKDLIASAVSTIDMDGEMRHFQVTNTMDGNLEPDVLELIDIGSTGRHTNEIGAGDFDYIIRVDNEIMKSTSKLSALKTALMKVLGQQDAHFKYKKVSISGIDTPVDIDITFVPKTDSINYSTDKAIKDQLHTIANMDEIAYRQVLANIIYAKVVLKSAGCYYPSGHSKCVLAGLGGVGVENWILSHRGSFIEATEDFLATAEKYSDFEDFKNHYKVWSFGENFYYEKDSHHKDITTKYEEFVSSNMDARGFEAMKKVLRQTLDKIQKVDFTTEEVFTMPRIK